MTALDATWHLINALVAPFGLAFLASLGAVLIWPMGRGWWGWRGWPGLYATSALCGTGAHVAVWWSTGAEGTMIGYAAMVGSVAVALWMHLFVWPASALKR